jgi:predicted Zn-dependent peptidase
MIMKRSELKQLIKEILVEEAKEIPEVYTVKLIKMYNGNAYTSPIWAAMLKPTRNVHGDVIVIDDFAYYDESGGQYYPNIRWYGSLSRGSQTNSNKTAPYISDSVEDMLSDLANGTYYSKETQEDFDSVKHTFPKGTKISEIKNQI